MNDTMENEIPSIKIGTIEIGMSKPCVIIAEGCDNHNGSVAKAKDIAQAALEAGADIVKFQLHLPDEEMDREGMKKTSSEMFSKWGDLYGFIEQNLLKPEAHAELVEYCKKIGIQYLCTPFSLKAAQILTEIGGDYGFKIGSGETEDLPMIEGIAKMGRPMMISTGMTELEEIDLTANLVRELRTPFCLAHCISVYSPKYVGQLQLGVIPLLRNRYDVHVGLSDHTPPEGVADNATGRQISEETLIWSAIAAGARFIEKHFTLDRNSPDADSRFSHDPQTLRRLVQSVRACEAALGSERRVFEEEKPVHIWAKRSLFANQDIPSGALIAREMLTSKRPGIGIRSKLYREVMGKRSARAIAKGVMIQWSDIVK